MVANQDCIRRPISQHHFHSIMHSTTWNYYWEVFIWMAPLGFHPYLLSVSLLKWKHHRTKPMWRSGLKSHLVMSIVHNADSSCCYVSLQWRCGIYGRVHVLHDQPWDRKCWFQSGSHQCFQGAHRRRQTSLCDWGWTLPGNSKKCRYRILNVMLSHLALVKLSLKEPSRSRLYMGYWPSARSR